MSIALPTPHPPHSVITKTVRSRCPTPRQFGCEWLFSFSAPEPNRLVQFSYLFCGTNGGCTDKTFSFGWGLLKLQPCQCWQRPPPPLPCQNSISNWNLGSLSNQVSNHFWTPINIQGIAHSQNPTLPPTPPTPLTPCPSPCLGQKTVFYYGESGGVGGWGAGHIQYFY